MLLHCIPQCDAIYPPSQHEKRVLWIYRSEQKLVQLVQTLSNVKKKDTTWVICYRDKCTGSDWHIDGWRVTHWQCSDLPPFTQANWLKKKTVLLINFNEINVEYIYVLNFQNKDIPAGQSAGNRDPVHWSRFAFPRVACQCHCHWAMRILFVQVVGPLHTSAGTRNENSWVFWKAINRMDRMYSAWMSKFCINKLFGSIRFNIVCVHLPMSHLITQL